eukprot:2275138-Prymnesium_polylepis.1
MVPAASGAALTSVRPSCFIWAALKGVADGMMSALGAGTALVVDVPFLSAWISLYRGGRRGSWHS